MLATELIEEREPETGAIPRAPFVSVIVPVRNEEKFIKNTLTQVLKQEYDSGSFEVLVVDGRSTDTTRDIVRDLMKDHPNLHLFDNPQRLSSAARNVGVNEARGDFLIVIDGHCQIDDTGYIQNVADAFIRSGADSLGRPQPLDVSRANSLQQAIAAARSSWLGHHPASFIYSDGAQFVPPQSVAVAYRKSVFEKVGMFDERFDACEDYEFNYRVARAGLSCYFTPRIAVQYHPRATLSGLFRQLVRYGRGRFRLLRKHPATFSLPSLIPALFVLGLGIGSILSMLNFWVALIFGSTLLVYGATVFSVSALIALKSARPRWLPWLLVVFPTIHLACGCGLLREMIAPRKLSVERV